MSKIPQDHTAIPRIIEIVKEKCAPEEIELKKNRIVFTLSNGKYFTVWYYDADCCTKQNTNSPEICEKHGQEYPWSNEDQLRETIDEAILCSNN